MILKSGFVISTPRQPDIRIPSIGAGGKKARFCAICTKCRLGAPMNLTGITVCLVTTMQIERTPLNFSRRDSSRLQLSASCTLQPPLSLTRRGQSRRGNRSPRDRDRCGARSVRARQAGWGTWPGDFERPRRHRPRCVRRPPQPRSPRRRKPPQRFPYPQAYGSETAATPPNGHARQERATEAFRPEAPLRQSALLRVLLPSASGAS